MIKRSIHQGHNSSVYVPNNRALECTKQKLIELKGEVKTSQLQLEMATLFSQQSTEQVDKNSIGIEKIGTTPSFLIDMYTTVP